MMILQTFILLFFLLFVTSCHKYVAPLMGEYGANLCQQIIKTVDESHLTIIHPDESLKQSKGIMVVHGLNNHPAIFKQLEEHLRTKGYTIARIALTGHSSAPQTDSNWRIAWQKEWLAGYCQLKKFLGSESTITVLAYSIGALVSSDNLQNIQGLKIQPLIVFAPAWSTHPHVSLVKLTGLKSLEWQVPSLGHPLYRANDSLNNKAYQALFSMQNAFAPTILKNIPILLIIDPMDELISLNGLRKIQIKNDLTIKWLEIDNSSNELEKSFHHLIIDEASAGKKEWPKILEAVDSML